MGSGPAGACLLIGAREQGPQSQEVLAALGALLQAPIYQERKRALLLTSALLGMQARRVDAHTQGFSDEGEAIAWLAGTA